MSIVLSIVKTPHTSSIFLICVAVSSQSKTILSISSFLHISAISSSLPEPMQVPLSKDGLFCVTLAITSPPAVSVSSSSSSRESSTSYEPVSTAASSTRSFFIVLSNISAILITPNVCYQAALRLFQA